MSFFEKCIKEMWIMKGNKYGKLFKSRYKTYIDYLLMQDRQQVKPDKKKKWKSLTTLAKQLECSPYFLRNLLKYERIIEDGNNKKVN
jgi:hypothetical protein